MTADSACVSALCARLHRLSRRVSSRDVTLSVPRKSIINCHLSRSTDRRGDTDPTSTRPAVVVGCRGTLPPLAPRSTSGRNVAEEKWFERPRLWSAARGHRPLAGSVDGVHRSSRKTARSKIPRHPPCSTCRWGTPQAVQPSVDSLWLFSGPVTTHPERISSASCSCARASSRYGARTGVRSVVSTTWFSMSYSM